MRNLLNRLRDWILIPIARQLSKRLEENLTRIERKLAEQNSLIDHQNYLLSAMMTDEQWRQILRTKEARTEKC